jgi:hypothetical protein
MKLRPEETELMGEWRVSGRTVERDPTAHRIDELIRKLLQRLGVDPSGWDTLYRDPDDGRLWQLSFPGSDAEGGGPPRLSVIEKAAARRKYGAIVDSG